MVITYNIFRAYCEYSRKEALVKGIIVYNGLANYQILSVIGYPYSENNGVNDNDRK
jgi:hypothetical protein